MMWSFIQNEFCQQYIECEEKAHAKAVECLTTNALAEAKVTFNSER